MNEKKLVIAEKPSVGRDIAKVLKCNKKGDGFLYNDNYIVSWAIGHLVQLKEPEDYNIEYKRWRFEHLPILPEKMDLKAAPNTKEQLNILKKLMNSKETSEIVCATDSGREGELIFRYIYEFVKCKKPVKRLWISSLTDQAILAGLKNMKPIEEYDKLYYSAKCRSEADWLVGMNATRAFTLTKGELLPIGRVQTPTLAMITARQEEINNFVPKDYFQVQADFTAKNGEYTGLWENGDENRTYKREQAEEITKKVDKKQGIIKDISKEKKQQPPPQLFDLTELQRECNRILGLSAKQTLATAQVLYEKHKIITYPRTDSRYITDDMITKLEPTLKSIGYEDLKSFVNNILPLKTPNSRIVNNAKVTDHHAIIPTGKKPPSSLSGTQLQVYRRILMNFIAAFFPVYVYEITDITTKVEGEIFKSRGHKDIEKGWTIIYEKERKPLGDLISLEKGEIVYTKKAQTLAKKTEPPKPYNEAALLSAMEHAGRKIEDESLKEAMKQSGLGTPSTRAAIIEKLISSDYLTRKQKNLVPTDKAMQIINILPSELISPETTGKWEKGLARIATGELAPEKFMESINRFVDYLIKESKKAK